MSDGADVERPRAALTVPALVAGAAAVTLGVSYALPTVTFRTIKSKTPEVYSIWGGIESLWEDGNTVLAPIVFLFSIVFPIAKLALLGWVLTTQGRSTRGSQDPRALVSWLRFLGKWSMLDVLIVGLFVGAIRIGLATASSLSGIHVFAAAIVLSMLASLTLARKLRAAAPRAAAHAAQGGRRGAGLWVDRALALVTFGAVAYAASQPLLVVTKSLFFSNQVALWSTSRAMMKDGERVLGAGLVIAVIALPLLRCLVSVIAAWSPRAPRRVVRLGALLDEWAMLDVFALALVIVHVKLEELADVRLSTGFWVVLAAAGLTLLDGWRQRGAARSVHP